MTWAILSDYSGVEETPDGFGLYETREAALRTLVDRLTTERNVVASKLNRAQTQLRGLTRHSVAPLPTTGKYPTREELEAAVLTYYAEKVPYRLIAKRTATTYNTVYNIVKRHSSSKDKR